MSVLEVPVLDISTLMAARDDTEVRATLTEDNPTLQRTIAELRAAAAEWGFFYISNHGVSEQQLDAFRSAMRAFFAQPQSAKDAVRRSKSNSRGYFDNELTKNKTDWKEGFDFAQDGEVAHVFTDDNWFGEVKNQWPSEENLHGFRETMVEYHTAVEHIARRLIQVFAVALGEDVDFFDQFFYKQLEGGVRARGNTNIVRLNHYPPAPEPEKTMGVYNHTDPGAVTVLLQDDTITSLQVFHRGTKQWYNVPPKPNTFVINIGEMIQVWSNDRFVAPEHRVLANKDASRYSAPLFFNPSLEAEVQPIIMDEGEKPHYRSVNWLKYILERAKAIYVDMGEEAPIDRFRITP